MTKAFNELYEELRTEVVKRTIEDIKGDWGDCDIRKDEYELTYDDIRRIRNEMISAVISELTYDLEYCFDEDRDDIKDMIAEPLIDDGFTVTKE